MTDKQIEAIAAKTRCMVVVCVCVLQGEITKERLCVQTCSTHICMRGCAAGRVCVCLWGQSDCWLSRALVASTVDSWTVIQTDR